MDQTSLELAPTFADVARALLGEDDVEATLKKVTTLAVETIDGCDHAGVSLVQGRRISTPAASDDVPGRVDAVQYETDQGPCLDAIREHETFKTDDLAKEDRWPKFSQRAAEETGVASMLSFRLFAEGDTMGALNLYSKQRAAFDDEALAVGSVFATHAAVALAGAQHDEQMQKALQGRDVIGQAKGILMAQQHVSADEAFDILRRASQRMNIKLRELAERVASRTPPDEKEGAA
ncbi:MAG: GAF and ANTAR domain-containing protein [Actinomycetota bacterium]|nr:GAF and ANTAR domain-containing protein [Actinomycetota bacterium]